MAVSHVFTNAVADAAGVLTVWYGATTAAVNATDIVRPSDWNSAHNQYLTITGNTAGQSTFSGTNIVMGGGANITLSGVNATQFNVVGGAGGGGSLNVSAGTTSNNLTAVTFADSNGVSFGLNGSVVTATVKTDYLTTAMLSNAATISNVRVSGGTTSNLLSAITFADSNGVSFGLDAGTMTATVRTNYASSSHSHAASGQNGSFAFDTLSFSNANGLSFGTSAGNAITASHNALTSQSNQNVTAGNGGFAFQTLSFSNVNGVSFGTSAGSAITASVAAQTNQTGGIYITAQSTGQSSSSTYDVRTLSFVPDGIISAGWSNGSFRVSATQSNQNVTAGNGGFAFQTLSFSNVNGISFGTSAGSAITASHNAITTARASTDAIGLATAQTNVTWTVNSNGLSFNAAGYAGTGTTFNGAGVSGSMTVNSVGVQLSLSGGTINQTGPNIGVSTDGNTAGSTGTVSTGNVVFVGGANITLSQSTAAAGSHATITIIGGAGGGGGIGAGVSTGGNTAGSTGTVTTGNVIFVGSNGITLSQSTGAAGSAATITFAGWPFLSRFWNGTPVSMAGGHANSSVSIVPFSVGFPYVASDVRFAFSNNVGTAANASTAYIDLSFSVVLYSRNGSTLSSILSGSTTLTKTWSSNATGSVTGPQQVQVTHAARTMTPGEYFWAVHASTTNTATGGAATTALGNTFSAIVIANASVLAFAPRGWGLGTNNSQGGIHGMGQISTGATVVSMNISDISQTGSRANAANMFFEHRNQTFF